MTEPQRETFRQALLSQEPHVPEDKYQEYRMKLEQAYVTAFRWERRALFTCLALLASALASMCVLAVIAMRWHVRLDGWPLAIPNGLLIAGVAFGYFWHFSKQRLSRCEDDRKVGQIAEINHKLDELTRRCDAHFGGGPAKENRP